MSTECCQCCKRKAGDLTARYVAVKKAVLNICNTCISKQVTYDPSEWIPDSDAVITCSK